MGVLLLSVNIMSHFRILPIIVLCFLQGGVTLAADSAVVVDESDSLYGQGVHAFFDSNYEAAVKILSKAEEMKINDPRPYYFLGLAYLRQKKTERANQYFKKAAQQEFSDRTLRDYAVSESLRRIQGEERQRIEKIRLEERTNAQIREQTLQEMRYGKETVPRENLATLQQTENDLGNNAFGVKPMNPLNKSEETAVITRTGTNPFGGVVASISSEPEQISAPTVPRTREPTVVRQERTFVNPNVSAIQQESARPAGNQTAAGSSMSGAARQLGKALGSIFSKKVNGE